jgi:transcriptional regulator with XRE-family HTH domain
MGRDGCATCRLGLPVMTAPSPTRGRAEVASACLCRPRCKIGWERIVVKNCNQIDISLGGRLREKRTSTGWSQEQQAEKLQIDPKDVYAYETGSKPISADRLLHLSKVLGVKPIYFFGFDDDHRPVNREAALLTLPDQGLRLHRAFIGVKNPALREAIVSLVIELARNDTAL